MTSVWNGLGLGVAVLAAAAVTASATPQSSSAERVHAAPVSARPAPPAPQYVRDRVNELGGGFDGRVGIAVRSIDEGWSTGWKADELYPQQSVSKLWVSITAMDAVDKQAAAHRVVDLISQPADLEEIFLELYEEPEAAADGR